MSILLRKVKIIDSKSPYNGFVKDVLINNDQIVQIDDYIEASARKVIEEDGLCVSPGWFEMHANFCDPGNEHKEDIDSGSSAAVFGGFTAVALSPETEPVIQTKNDIEYLYKKSESQPINIYPLGASTTNLKGKELTELYDMHQAGAIGFYNGKMAIQNPNIQKLVLLYTRTFQAPVMIFPNETELSDQGQMNEGELSTSLALKGIPNLSEEISINRDLYVAEYAESPVHFACISTAGSVKLIRDAKERGVSVTCSVNLYNLVLTDEVLSTYDTRYKVMPPIRNETDRSALIDGIKDGTIDAISIDHIPQDIEVKKCEFENAAFGMRGLETAFGIYGKYLSKDINLEKWVDLISHNPREILDAPRISLNEGNIAELSLFKLKPNWTLNEEKIKLRSKNNPFAHEELTGKPFGIINKGVFHSA